jgi:hypothetical protein
MVGCSGCLYVLALLFLGVNKNPLCILNCCWWNCTYLNLALAARLLPLGKKKKVKCTLVQALRLCTGHTAHRGSGGIALLFHDHGTRRVWGVSVTPWPLFTPGKDPVPIVQVAGWATGPVWTGVENLAFTGIQSPDSLAHSQSLYWLCCLAHFFL